MAKDRWVLLPSHKPLSEALPAECTQARYERTGDSGYRIVAACLHALYELNQPDGTWINRGAF